MEYISRDFHGWKIEYPKVLTPFEGNNSKEIILLGDSPMYVDQILGRLKMGENGTLEIDSGMCKVNIVRDKHIKLTLRYEDDFTEYNEA